jgi:hypothetical protein
MPLPLDKPLKREIQIAGVPHTVTVSPLGVRVVRKGFRKGRVLSWRALLEAAAPEAGLDEGAGPGAGG